MNTIKILNSFVKIKNIYRFMTLNNTEILWKDVNINKKPAIINYEMFIHENILEDKDFFKLIDNIEKYQENISFYNNNTVNIINDKIKDLWNYGKPTSNFLKESENKDKIKKLFQFILDNEQKWGGNHKLINKSVKFLFFLLNIIEPDFFKLPQNQEKIYNFYTKQNDPLFIIHNLYLMLDNQFSIKYYNNLTNLEKISLQKNIIKDAKFRNYNMDLLTMATPYIFEENKNIFNKLIIKKLKEEVKNTYSNYRILPKNINNKDFHLFENIIKQKLDKNCFFLQDFFLEIINDKVINKSKLTEFSKILNAIESYDDDVFFKYCENAFNSHIFESNSKNLSETIMYIYENHKSFLNRIKLNEDLNSITSIFNLRSSNTAYTHCLAENYKTLFCINGYTDKQNIDGLNLKNNNIFENIFITSSPEDIESFFDFLKNKLNIDDNRLFTIINDSFFSFHKGRYPKNQQDILEKINIIDKKLSVGGNIIINRIINAASEIKDIMNIDLIINYNLNRFISKLKKGTIEERELMLHIKLNSKEKVLDILPILEKKLNNKEKIIFIEWADNIKNDDHETYLLVKQIKSYCEKNILDNEVKLNEQVKINSKQISKRRL